MALSKIPKQEIARLVVELNMNKRLDIAIQEFEDLVSNSDGGLRNDILKALITLRKSRRLCKKILNEKY